MTKWCMRKDTTLPTQIQAQHRGGTERRGNRTSVKFDLNTASTLTRSCENAPIVSDLLGVPVENEADCMDRHYGPLTDLLFEMAWAKYPRPEYPARMNLALLRRAATASFAIF